MSIVHKLIATGFGVGYSPIAPGTAGSLLACVILALLHYALPEQFGYMPGNALGFLSLIIITFLLGTKAAHALESEMGKDPSAVVVDEIIGMWLTMLFIPLSWQNLLIGFIAFRFFDIAKPLGIRQVDQKVKGGLGIMLDDVIAGIYANLVMQTLIRFWI